MGRIDWPGDAASLCAHVAAENAVERFALFLGAAPRLEFLVYV
jgi:hypothetical protein